MFQKIQHVSFRGWREERMFSDSWITAKSRQNTWFSYKGQDKLARHNRHACDNTISTTEGYLTVLESVSVKLTRFNQDSTRQLVREARQANARTFSTLIKGMDWEVVTNQKGERLSEYFIRVRSMLPPHANDRYSRWFLLHKSMSVI